MIIETKKIGDLLKYINPETLLVLDVDNTLIEPVDFAGGTAWFMHLIKKFDAQGINEEEAIKFIYPVFVELQSIIKVKPVEKETVSVIGNAKQVGVDTLALTWRGDVLVKKTVEQLSSVGIDLEKQSIYNEEIFVKEAFGYQNGVLSVNPGYDKGPALERFLDIVGYVPNNVVFVDDSSEFIDDVHKMLDRKKIKSTCIRYTATEDRFVKFDLARANDEIISFFRGTENEKLIEKIL